MEMRGEESMDDISETIQRTTQLGYALIEGLQLPSMFVYNILLLSSYFRLQFLEFMLTLIMVSRYERLSEACSLNNYLAQRVSSQMLLSTFHDVAQA